MTVARKPEGFDVADLFDLPVDALRDIWRAQLDVPLPSVQGPEFVRRELAWRLEARVHGDIHHRLKQRLDALARQVTRGAAGARTASRLAVGATLIREYDGVTHAVVVLENGFLFEGATWISLSAIARQITGVRWSGPRFFGLTAASKP